MKIKFSNSEYELLEFNYHIDDSYERLIHILELLIETNNIDDVREELNDSFIVEANECTYVFSGFETHEYYMVGDTLLQVVCIKEMWLTRYRTS